MLDTFIKNKGITKTIIHNKNKNYYNEVEWDADYDGENAHLSLDIDENGTKGYVKMKMNNDELAELLNIPSEKNMLDKRLYSDFLSFRPKKEYKIIEIPKSILQNNNSYEKIKKKVRFENEKQNFAVLPLENEVVENIYTHVSSPEPQEEILFPLTIDEIKTRKHRKHKKHHSHVTYKVYRKNKHSSKPASLSSKKTLKRYNHHGQRSRRTF